MKVLNRMKLKFPWIRKIYYNLRDIISRDFLYFLKLYIVKLITKYIVKLITKYIILIYNEYSLYKIYK